jgi:hypothetical protein
MHATRDKPVLAQYFRRKSAIGEVSMVECGWCTVRIEVPPLGNEIKILYRAPHWE